MSNSGLYAGCYGGRCQVGAKRAISPSMKIVAAVGRAAGEPLRPTWAHLECHLSQLSAGGMSGAVEHGGRQSVIRARSRGNGHQVIVRGSRRSPVPGESERCKAIRRPTAGWRPARIAQALAVGEEPPPSLRRSEYCSVYAAAALPSSNASSHSARSRTTSRRVTAMIARFLPVRGASRS
jgi:hypothetical protein